MPILSTPLTVFIGKQHLTVREFLVEWLGVYPCPIEPGLINVVIEFWRLYCPAHRIGFGNSPFVSKAL